MERLLIIGGVAAGTKVAAKAKRENPDLEVTVLTREEYVSYAGCGLPYFIGDVIKDKNEIIIKTPESLKKELDINILTLHEVLKIIPEEKKVIAINKVNDEKVEIMYDKLVIATGASPVIPEIPGISLKRIFTLRTVSDALVIKSLIDAGRVKRALIVGGGFIGLEMAENLYRRGIEVTIIEHSKYILPGFDPEIALIAQKYLAKKGIKILTEEKVISFNGNEKGEVTSVITDKRSIETDFVLWSAGVKPNIELAKDAGIEIGETGAIRVNEYLETSIEDIYGVGDCVEMRHLITGKPVWYPMGSTANKMGRVAAINVAHSEKKEIFSGVLGTAIIKLFELKAAKTGLTEKEALKEGYEVETVLVPSNDLSHYYPGNKTIIIKMIADRKTHRILGAQIIGEGVIDKPIDIIVTAMSLKARIEDLAKMDFAYAPPFSMAMSSVIVTSNVMLNKLYGKLHGISPMQLKDKLEEDIQILDTRSEAEFVVSSIPNSINIPFDQLRHRALELDKEKETVIVCKIGKRAYLAYITLKKLGFKNIKILDGGITAYPFDLV